MGQRSPNNPLRPFLRAFMHAAERRFDSAEVAARALAATTQDLTWQASAAGTLAAVNLVRGRLATAEVQIRQARTFDEQRGVPGKYLEDAIGIAVMTVHYRNAPDAAQREVEAALRRHPLASIPAQDRPYLGLAWLYADAGRPERARQLIAEYETAVPEGGRPGQPVPPRAAAQIALSQGPIPGAIPGYPAWDGESPCAGGGVVLLGPAVRPGCE